LIFARWPQYAQAIEFIGAPDPIRTCDLCLRSKITCPSEKCDRARYAIQLKQLDILVHTSDVPIRKHAPISSRPLTRCLRRRSCTVRRNVTVKITKRVVEAAKAREKDYVIWDDELPGFGLRVFSSGKRSYVIQYRIGGRSRRYTIGLHGAWAPETARREAKVQLGRSLGVMIPSKTASSIKRRST
jgi:hypothetical protein